MHRHIPEAGRLLGRAFVDNPAQLASLTRHSPAERGRVVEALHRSFTAAAIDHWTAEGLFAGERMLGVMLTLGPGVYPPSLRAKLSALRGALGAGLRGMANYARIDEHMSALHPTEPHHYLFILGVDPSEQGRGHGRAMVEALNARADAEGLPCYLETDRETSVRLYESVGYRVVTEDILENVNNLKMWTMRRGPQLRLS
jgi:ribosomal protein S18 acetylase RimI-like enzyme